MTQGPENKTQRFRAYRVGRDTCQTGKAFPGGTAQRYRPARQDLGRPGQLTTLPLQESRPCRSETQAESLHDWPVFQLRDVLSTPSLAAPTSRDSRKPLSCSMFIKTGKAVISMITKICNNMTLQIFDMYGRTDIRADASRKVAQVVKDKGQWILHLFRTEGQDLSGLHEARTFDNKQLTVAAGIAWVASGR